MDRSVILRETRSGVEIDVMVSPSSPRSEVQGIDEWRRRLMVKVRAPPKKGEANAEVESVLSDFFRARTEVLRGHTNRMKTVLVHTDLEQAIARLEALNARP